MILVIILVGHAVGKWARLPMTSRTLMHRAAAELRRLRDALGPREVT